MTYYVSSGMLNPTPLLTHQMHVWKLQISFTYFLELSALKWTKLGSDTRQSLVHYKSVVDMFTDKQTHSFI